MPCRFSNVKENGKRVGDHQVIGPFLVLLFTLTSNFRSTQNFFAAFACFADVFIDLTY